MKMWWAYRKLAVRVNFPHMGVLHDGRLLAASGEAKTSVLAMFNSVWGQQNRFAQFSSFALLVSSECIQIVRSNLEMPHDQRPSHAGNLPLLSALTAEPRFAATVVQSAVRNHSAIIATTTMPQTTACENLLRLNTQHADIRTLHK